MPRLFVLLTLLLLGTAHGAELVGLGEERCTEQCADDDEQGQCAPECQDCTCCAHHAASVLAVPSGSPLPAPVARQRTEAPTAQPQAAHARKIPHIPRPALA